MRRLIVEVRQARRPRTELCFRFEPERGEEPLDSLMRLRAAVFLTGVAIESAKVVERDREWNAPTHLLKVLNDPLGARRRKDDVALKPGPTCWLRVLSSAVH
jgi:hypothetical protein